MLTNYEDVNNGWKVYFEKRGGLGCNWKYENDWYKRG